MSDTDRVGRKPPVEPLKVNNTLYDRRGFSSPAARCPDAVTLEQLVVLLEDLSMAYGRKIQGKVHGNEVVFSDESGEVAVLGAENALSMAEEIRLFLKPLLDRKA
ncbi:MAG: hypothetical protein STSR0007_12380 [Thermovirga sp.]